MKTNDKIEKCTQFLSRISNCGRSADAIQLVSASSLAFCRQFYHSYPIANAVRSQFNWFQHHLLIQINDTDKRKYYEQKYRHNRHTFFHTFVSLLKR